VIPAFIFIFSEAKNHRKRAPCLEVIMKRTILRVICFISALSLVCACAGFQDNRLGTLAAKLKIDTTLSSSKSAMHSGEAGQKTADRVIRPSEIWAPVRFVISGIGPGGADFSVDGSEAGIETKLVPGAWAITVQAFSADGKEVAGGTAQCMLQPGRTTAVTITLYPIEGTGDISLTIAKSFELPAGARITGSLVHKGLPGHPAPSAPTILPVDIPAEQTSLSFAGIPAGHYALVLTLVASDGVISGGCAQTIMVMAGFQTTGSCTIEMGMPMNYFTTELYPNSQLPPPLMSVGHVFPDSRKAIPIAIPSYQPSADEMMERKWYVNGEEAGNAVRLIGNRGLLPEGALAFPQSTLPYQVSLVRADLVETSNTSFRSGSAGVVLEAGSANDSGNWGWRASYDYSAALCPSLYEMVALYSSGTGNPYSVRAVAAAPSGLIIVSGLDDDGALHAFAAGYGAEIDPPSPGSATTLSIDASWIRLWRDRIKISGTYRTADRLAVSEDGRFIAAASSSSNWLRLSVLDEDGRLLRSFPLINVDAGFGNLKGLSFSSDGQRLYAAADSSDSIYAFDVSEDTIALSDIFPLTKTGVAEDLSLQDLKVTSSGAIIVTAKEASRIYVLSDEVELAEQAIIQGTSGGTAPHKPTSLAISKDGDAFYALCNGEEITCFSRTAASSSYDTVFSFILPPEAEGADFIASGKPLGGIAEMIFAVGEGNVEFFEIDGNRNVAASYPIATEFWDLAGVATSEGLCFTKGAFIVAGGSSGIVSVFGTE